MPADRTEQVVEAMASAFAAEQRAEGPRCLKCDGHGVLVMDHGDGHGPGGEVCPDCVGSGMQGVTEAEMLRRALSVALPPDLLAVLRGEMVAVPVEPTQEMRTAGEDTVRLPGITRVADVYCAMLAARPVKP